MSLVLKVSTHIYGVSKEIDGKTFIILQFNLGMWPFKSIISSKQALFWGFQHTFMGFPRNRWENIYFGIQPRHVTSQINCLWKTSPTLRVSTQFDGEIDGKMFIFRVNLGMWPSNWSPQKNDPCSEGFNTHLFGFQRYRWENVHF